MPGQRAAKCHVVAAETVGDQFASELLVQGVTILPTTDMGRAQTLPLDQLPDGAVTQRGVVFVLVHPDGGEPQPLVLLLLPELELLASNILTLLALERRRATQEVDA